MDKNEYIELFAYNSKQRKIFKYIDEYSSKIERWIIRNDFNHNQLTRYMLVGLFLEYRGANHAGSSFNTVLENFTNLDSRPVLKKKLTAINTILSKPIMSTFEYFQLLTIRSVSEISAVNLYNFVVYGTNIHSCLIKDKVYGGLFGHCVGDALGVPVEFYTRETLQNEPVFNMREGGTHNQYYGTWSDDSSLTFCLIDSLNHGFNIDDIGKQFCSWLYEGKWTSDGFVFDVGNITKKAISRIKQGIDPLQSGEIDEMSNGNGSLMRILPLAFYFKDKTLDELLTRVKEVSSITHGHMRTIIGCSYYVFFAQSLLNRNSLDSAYKLTNENISKKFSTNSELLHYSRILNNDIATLSESDIYSSGYIVHTLEACLWCLLTSNNYTEAVLKAVNLGEDTDTTGAVTGGLAGIHYGYNSIPKEWIDKLAKKDEINMLLETFYKTIINSEEDLETENRKRIAFIKSKYKKS